MNSLNILSAFGSTASTPAPKDDGGTYIKQEDGASVGLGIDDSVLGESVESEKNGFGEVEVKSEATGLDAVDEKTPLLGERNTDGSADGAWYLPTRIASTVFGSFRVVLTALLAPGRYIIACFYDDQGHFSAVLPLYRIGRKLTRRKANPAQQNSSASAASEETDGSKKRQTRGARSRSVRKSTPSPYAESSSTAVTSESELDPDVTSKTTPNLGPPSRNTRSRSSISSNGDEIAPAKRSIKIKLHAPDAAKQRRPRKSTSAGRTTDGAADDAKAAAAAALKSPTSSASVSKVSYPRPPAPPRPLVPRRQPSYSNTGMGVGEMHKKTLIIDLDETLIHSMSKGGRYTAGHMVEVRLSSPLGIGGGATYGPQVPILYYVHKRPYCDEFLRKVCKWYNLVVFTASVQEYADPVIDWLELERKYFSGRYYRQHCTFRNGTYIKDLAHIEPDLSKVMILDNSPMSYFFHEDNAIPIEGWISDPTDNDLLHLIPLLEGLQYATDVRALLALRLGEPQAA